jgi:hypothetical protein
MDFVKLYGAFELNFLALKNSENLQSDYSIAVFNPKLLKKIGIRVNS